MLQALILFVMTVMFVPQPEPVFVTTREVVKQVRLRAGIVLPTLVLPTQLLRAAELLVI
jgi:hypothetical protein